MMEDQERLLTLQSDELLNKKKKVNKNKTFTEKKCKITRVLW